MTSPMPDIIRKPGAMISACRACHSTVRYQDVGPVLVVSSRFCPLCGSDDTHTTNDRINYWLHFGIELGLPEDPRTQALVEGIFGLWEPSAGDPLKFVDYLKATLTEMKVIS